QSAQPAGTRLECDRADPLSILDQVMHSTAMQPNERGQRRAQHVRCTGRLGRLGLRRRGEIIGSVHIAKNDWNVTRAGNADAIKMEMRSGRLLLCKGEEACRQMD